MCDPTNTLSEGIKTDVYIMPQRKTYCSVSIIYEVHKGQVQSNTLAFTSAKEEKAYRHLQTNGGERNLFMRDHKHPAGLVSG